jgi:hypothetical protein
MGSTQDTLVADRVRDEVSELKTTDDTREVSYEPSAWTRLGMTD